MTSEVSTSSSSIISGGKLCSIMEAASALTSLGGGDIGVTTKDESSTSSHRSVSSPSYLTQLKKNQSVQVTNAKASDVSSHSSASCKAGSEPNEGAGTVERHIPVHKKPDAALTFPEKLMNMMDYATEQSKGKSDQYCISWLPDGSAFIIRDPEAFTQSVLPHFFKATKFSSFTRKLYRWGFRQVNRGIGPNDPVIFGNEDFHRDSRHMMAKMKSVTAAGNRKAAFMESAVAAAATTPSKNSVSSVSASVLSNGMGRQFAHQQQQRRLGETAYYFDTNAQGMKAVMLSPSSSSTSSSVTEQQELVMNSVSTDSKGRKRAMPSNSPRFAINDYDSDIVQTTKKMRHQLVDSFRGGARELSSSSQLSSQTTSGGGSGIGTFRRLSLADAIRAAHGRSLATEKLLSHHGINISSNTNNVIGLSSNTKQQDEQQQQQRNAAAFIQQQQQQQEQTIFSNKLLYGSSLFHHLGIPTTTTGGGAASSIESLLLALSGGGGDAAAAVAAAEMLIHRQRAAAAAVAASAGGTTAKLGTTTSSTAAAGSSAATNAAAAAALRAALLNPSSLGGHGGNMKATGGGSDRGSDGTRVPTGTAQIVNAAIDALRFAI